MQIQIKTTTGTGRVYNFNIGPTTTILQLKQLLGEEEGQNEVLQTICLLFNGKELEDENKTLADYNIQSNSALQKFDLKTVNGRNLGFIGSRFIDVSDKQGLKRIEFSNEAPPWRISIRGLCLEGYCKNEKCEAHNHRVIIRIGYKRFDLLVDSNETTTVCPMCRKYVDPITCGFNNCWWRFEGIKQDETCPGAPPRKCSSSWERADNAYHCFEESDGQLVVWRQLILEAVENKPSV